MQIARAALYLFCTVLYCHLSPVWLYHIMPHYPIKGKAFGGGKKVTEYKNVCFFYFSTTFHWNISHSKKTEGRYHKCTDGFMQSACCSFPILIVFELTRRIPAKNSNTKCHKNNPPSGSRGVACGQTYSQTDKKTDRLDEVSGLFL